MKYTFLILTILTTIICGAQHTDIFKIHEIIGPFTLPKPAADFVSMPENQLFEDDIYIVTRTCSGEWGGTIKFLNKNSGITYSASATCPISVNKIKSTYYVSSTLNHIGSFSEFIKIEDPEKLEVFKPGPTFKTEMGIGKIRGSDESHSNKGVENMMKGQFVFLTVMTSFVYKNQLYHILCDDEKTFLGKIENNTIVNLGAISSDYLCSSTPNSYTTADNHIVFPFYGEDIDGYYDIYENEITVSRSLKNIR